MSIEESRAVVLQFVEEAFGGHSRDRMDDLIAEDYVRHMPGGHRIVGRDPIGHAAAEQGWAACPDWSYEIEVLLADGELVAVRVSAGGTHTQRSDLGPWRGLAPDVTRYSTTWTAIYRVRDGEIVEQWLDGHPSPTTRSASLTESIMDASREERAMLEQRFDTGEVDLNYAEGPATGPPLVLLHGGGGTWRGLKPIIPALSARWHVYAPDLRGHGASDWTPEHYTADDFARDIERLLASVVREPAVLLGHSLGASIALIAAARRPDQVRALILGDAPKPPYRDETGHDYVKRIHGYAEAMQLPSGLSSDPSALTVFRDETERYLAGFDVLLFRHVACPVLILQADPAYGSQLNDADVTEVLQLFPDAHYAHITGCGHGLWSIQKEPVLSIIQAFLDTVG